MMWGVERKSPNWTRRNHWLLDCMKQGVLKGIRPPLPEGAVEHRYEETGDEFILRSWHDNVETMGAGLMDSQPEKLRNIVTVAKLGGHMAYSEDGLHTGIVWFLTDGEFNLIEFYPLKGA